MLQVNRSSGWRHLRAFRWRPDRDGERAFSVVHLGLIVELAARYKLPAIYFERYFVTGGGLISFGADFR